MKANERVQPRAQETKPAGSVRHSQKVGHLSVHLHDAGKGECSRCTNVVLGQTMQTMTRAPGECVRQTKLPTRVISSPRDPVVTDSARQRTQGEKQHT
jgi:hypothetical protein